MKRSDEMSSKERVLAAVNSEDFDRYPVICPTSVANIECMELSSAFFPSAHTDAVKMANLASTSRDILGFDSVMPYYSVHLESRALGCEVDWGEVNRIPFVRKRLLSSPEDLIIPLSFLEKPEIRALLNAIILLKKKYKGQVPIIGKVIGPWTLAYNIYGAENLTVDTILEPVRTKQFLKELLKVSLEFARAQIEAGADMLTWADHVTSDLISPGVYAEFALPMQQIAAESLQKDSPVILHICGNVMDRLKEIKQSGFKLFHIDSRNDIGAVRQYFQEDVKLCGAVNNPISLLTGSERDIRDEVLKNIEDGIALIAPECAIPAYVTNRSLKLLPHTVRSM